MCGSALLLLLPARLTPAAAAAAAAAACPHLQGPRPAHCGAAGREALAGC